MKYMYVERACQMWSVHEVRSGQDYIIQHLKPAFNEHVKGEPHRYRAQSPDRDKFRESWKEIVCGCERDHADNIDGENRL